MVVDDKYRRLGILRSLHPVACYGMELLHQVSLNNNSSENKSQQKQHHHSSSSTIKAIFAETNTVDAGDVSPEMILKRHEILYKLGYKHIKFPYVQPPLSDDSDSFDHIMLLLYCGDDNNDNTTTTIETDILYQYVVDFYQSVMGYDDDNSEKYKQHWYYQLVHWFQQRHPTTEIVSELPWKDVTNKIQHMMDVEIMKNNDATITTTKNIMS